MRHQKSGKQSRITRIGQLAVASFAGAAMLTVFVPGTATGEVEVTQRYLTAEQARLTHGEELYTELCAVCHGYSGKGDGPAATALRQIPTDLTLLAVSNNDEFPRAELEKSIYGKGRIDAHGSMDMPVWGRAFEYTKPEWTRTRRINFAQHRIHNIVEYIETLQVQ